MTVGNYVRNLPGLDAAVVCGYCGQAPSPPRHRGQALRAATPSGALQTGGRWGFCAMRSALSACRRRVAPLHGVIPPAEGPGHSGAHAVGGLAGVLATRPHVARSHVSP